MSGTRLAGQVLRAALRVALYVASLAPIVIPTDTAAQVSAPATDDSTRTALRALRIVEGEIQANGRFVYGNATVSPADTITGPLVTINGDADVAGTVLGDVTAVFGDVTIREGADVHGGATAWRGRVIVDGGRVRGEMRATPPPVPPPADATPPAPPMSRLDAIAVSVGWTAMLAIIGLIALVLFSHRLDATAAELSDRFGTAVSIGLVGQLGFVPFLIVLLVVLAVTVIGILLIPFALLAVPVAFAGMLIHGWLAMALTVGRAFGDRTPGQDRAKMIRALLTGIVVLMSPWLVAAVLTGTAGDAVVRFAATGITWGAATAGLGATLLSRAGTWRRRGPQPHEREMESAGWQTPTPIAGVAAARRPVSPPPPTDAR